MSDRPKVLVGVLNALDTPWGLTRHYWVVAKLLLSVVATTVLLLESRTIDALATEAASAADPRTLSGTLPHSIGGLLVPLIVVLLSMYKPRGLTRYGWRKQQGQRRSLEPRGPSKVDQPTLGLHHPFDPVSPQDHR